MMQQKETEVQKVESGMDARIVRSKMLRVFMFMIVLITFHTHHLSISVSFLLLPSVFFPPTLSLRRLDAQHLLECAQCHIIPRRARLVDFALQHHCIRREFPHHCDRHIAVHAGRVFGRGGRAGRASREFPDEIRHFRDRAPGR